MSTLSPAKWNHRKKAEGEDTSDLVSATLAQFSDRSSLLRENLQNSLDRRLNDDEPVRVVINVAKAVTVDPDDAQYFLGDEWSAIQASKVLPSEKPTELTELSYLTIEEFNTTGLKGDCELDDAEKAKEDENDFWHFFRAAGISGKSGVAGGRWGAGKMVYNAVSKVRTALFYSVRDDACAPREFIMGVSHLGPHKDEDGEQRVDKGVFATFKQGGDFPYPISNSSDISRFKKAFHLQRGPEERGLSVVIPFPIDRLKTDDFLIDCVTNYLYRVLSGHLTLEIRLNNQAHSMLTNASIRSVCSRIDGLQKFESVLDFAEWVSQLSSDDYIVSANIAGVNSEGNDERPSWKSPPFSESQVNDIVSQYESKGQVALKVRTQLSVGGESHEGAFFVCARRTKQKQRGEWQYVRAGMSIPHANASGFVSSRMQGITHTHLDDVEDDIVSSFLGDCENPSHTNWSQDSEKAISKGYKYRQDWVRFVKNSASWLSQILDAPSDEEDVETLADLFPNPQSQR